MVTSSTSVMGGRSLDAWFVNGKEDHQRVSQLCDTIFSGGPRPSRCSKLTPNICGRVGLVLPEERRQRRHNITMYGAFSLPTASAPPPLPTAAPTLAPSQSLVPAPSQSLVPAPSQSLVPAPSQSFVTARQVQLGSLNAMTVLQFEKILNNDLSNIQNTLALNLTSVITHLQEIRRVGKDALTPPNTGMVLAHTIKSILLVVRRDISTLQDFVNQSLYHNTISAAILSPLKVLSDHVTDMLDTCNEAIILSQTIGASSHQNLLLAGHISSVYPCNIHMGQEVNINARSLLPSDDLPLQETLNYQLENVDGPQNPPENPSHQNLLLAGPSSGVYPGNMRMDEEVSGRVNINAPSLPPDDQDLRMSNENLDGPANY